MDVWIQWLHLSNNLRWYVEVILSTISTRNDVGGRFGSDICKLKSLNNSSSDDNIDNHIPCNVFIILSTLSLVSALLE